MIERMSITAYAEYRGVSQARISQLVKTILAPAHKKERGRNRKYIDVKMADEILADGQNPISVAAAKKTKDPKKPKKALSKKDEKAKDEQAAHKKASTQMVSISTAIEYKENYNYRLKEIEYLKKKKELLPVDEVKEAWIKHVLSARTKILSIKSKLAPVLKDAVEPENFEMLLTRIDTLVVEVLEDLSAE